VRVCMHVGINKIYYCINVESPLPLDSHTHTHPHYANVSTFGQQWVCFGGRVGMHLIGYRIGW